MPLKEVIDRDVNCTGRLPGEFVAAFVAVEELLAVAVGHDREDVEFL